MSNGDRNGPHFFLLGGRMYRKPRVKRWDNKGIRIVSILWVYVYENVVYEATEQSAQNLVNELRLVLHLYGHPVVQLGLGYQFSPEDQLERLPQPTEVPDLPEGYDKGLHVLPDDNHFDIYGDRKFLYRATLEEAAALYIQAAMSLSDPTVTALRRYTSGQAEQ